MEYQYISYIWPLIASALTTISLGLFVLMYRHNSKGAASFVLSMIVLTIWSSSNALEMSAMDFTTKLFWANMQYFAYCYSPVTLLSLCMEFTGYDSWVRNKRVLCLAIIPTIIIALVWTNGFHGLVRYNMDLDYSGLFPVIHKEYGPVFYIHALYSHFLNISACILLIKAVSTKQTIYRKQAVVLFIGLVLIELPNVLYISGLSPIKKFDITPVFFGPAGLITVWGIFRFKLFDVIPIAWGTIVRNMDTGIMVLDLKNRVLDINPAFKKIICCDSQEAVSKNANEVCGNVKELSGIIDGGYSHREFTIAKNGMTKIYEASTTLLYDENSVKIGRLMLIYDITKNKQEQQEYLRQQWKQAVTVERERYARDMHDNLGQVLSFISLQAQGIRQELRNAGVDTLTLKLDKLIDAAQTTNKEIREYICSIRNNKYFNDDFIYIVKQYILMFERQTSIKTKLDIPVQFSWNRIAPDVRIHILNIIKEALNNIRKHAEADNVLITFTATGEQLCICIKDDGKGFDAENQCIGEKNKFGLSIMRERAAEINAQISIKSTPGEGSSIILYLPVKGERKNENEGYVG